MVNYDIKTWINDNVNAHPVTNLLQTSQYKDEFIKHLLFFDKCFNASRFDDPDVIAIIGKSFMNIYGDHAYEMFDYFMSKSVNYVGRGVTLNTYRTFKNNLEYNYTMLNVYDIAKKDNLKEYKKILDPVIISLNDFDIAHLINEFAGNIFVSKTIANYEYTIYCFNGKTWENNDNVLINYISGTLYDFYHNLTTLKFKNSRRLGEHIKNLDKLKDEQTILDIITAYKIIIIGLRNQLEFNEKRWLIPIKDTLYDIRENIIRDCRYEDYISIPVS